MGCSSSSDASEPLRQPNSASSSQKSGTAAPAKPANSKAAARSVKLQRPKGYDAAFLQRHSPSGEIWADYVAAAPPAFERGKLTGPWAEAVYAGVVFELTNDGWDQNPAFADGPVGYVIEYLQGCGYGTHAQALEQAEEKYRQELERPAHEGSRAFLQHRARNGQTWKKYLESAKAVQDKAGWVNGAWGECITAAVIFEHENPGWERLGPYSADGPAGQVLAYLQDLGQGSMVRLLEKTEEATHKAVEQGGKLPVFDATYYQPPVKIAQAPQVGQKPPRPSGRKKAVLVGCNYPGTSAQLNGCVNDVNRWRGLLMNLYGFKQQDMVCLTDSGQTSSMHYPTRNNMLNAIRWLVEGAEPGDVLFFQFSGHGAQREADDDSELDGMDELLLPTDYNRAGMIVDHELFDLLVVPLPSGCKLTVILDCCHSGSALDLPFVWEEHRQSWNTERYPWHTAGDVQMFSGCEDEQCSMDAVTRQGLPGGAMTTAMCDVLEEHARKPPGPYPALLGAMTNVLQERGFDQRPRLSSSQAFDVMQKPFHVADFIVPNLNQQLGQLRRPAPKPQRDDPFKMYW
mmetsp:Transcript_35813/g.65006  ORF Transcript_35813/g.65006 Transcript_35813/m.65006 type:complete len:571 (+) Transcript_35813:26-1738(+)